MDSGDEDTNSADATESADLTDSADSVDSTDSEDSADSTDLTYLVDSTDFSISFTLLLKVLYLMLSYPLSYTSLKGEPQISTKYVCTSL